jgi:hypothetical protein
MRSIVILFIISILTVLSSCRKDFVFEPSKGNLEFSKDTVYLDTVFTNVGSSTYMLKVYNRSNADITIPKIQLGHGNLSKYRMMIDGMEGVDEDNSGHGDGKIFNNVELLAKDSLYIFVETTADVASANPTDFLYTDQIKFDEGSNLQTVELVTLIQDAVFLYPQKFVDATTNAVTYESLPLGEDAIYGFILDHNDHNDEYVWTKNKPYVIYGYAGIPDGETLNVEAGARIYFHANSGIIVGSGGSLKINGAGSNTDALENEVIFEGDRLEPEYSDVPGQWGLIWMSQGSVNNQINHLTLKNATVGILVGDVENSTNTTLKIDNTQIYNTSNVGILARTAKIEGTNLVINSAGQASIACTEGGSYSFKHCTFNNDWSSSKQMAVLISNYKTVDNVAIPVNLNQAEFSNCIIYGSNQIELFLDKVDGASFQSQFNNCLIKFNDSGTVLATNPLYDFIRNEQNGNIKNKTPNFFNKNQNKLNIDPSSPAFAKGDVQYLVPFDILGVARTTPPDMGAYQNAPFPE